ncbi:MAG: acetolactate synthase AlsS [Burkholderiales bacterium]
MERRTFLSGTAIALTAAAAPASAGAQPSTQAPAGALPASGRQGRHQIVDVLEAQGLTHVFGVPGAAIDPIVDAMIGRKVQMVHAAHEANAAFMAGAFGRITGRPTACMSTSGPGATNLAAGVVCSTAEGDPVVAITGEPPRSLGWRIGNQNVNATAVFTPVTKSSVGVEASTDILPILANAFRIASMPRQGAAHVAIPLDVTMAAADPGQPITLPDPPFGVSPPEQVREAARLFREAKLPVVLVGRMGGAPAAARALRSLLSRTPIPVVEVFEGAGALSRAHASSFVGRVGDHANQPGDALLAIADTILTVGFELSEYDPTLWLRGSRARVIHLSSVAAIVTRDYRPVVELRGDIAGNLEALSAMLPALPGIDWVPVREAQKQLAGFMNAIEPAGPGVSPVAFIRALREAVGDDTTVVSDVGSTGLWMIRNFLAFEPRRLLVDSKGWGALGTGLPKAIGTCFARPGEKVVCITGDGSFLMGGMEMQTAARLKLPIVQFIWQDGTYNLVEIASRKAFGRWDGFAFRHMDIPAFATAFGARGFRIDSNDDIRPVIARALAADGPVMVEVRVDYSANSALIAQSRITYAH